MSGLRDNVNREPWIHFNFLACGILPPLQSRVDYFRIWVNRNVSACKLGKQACFQQEAWMCVNV